MINENKTHQKGETLGANRRLVRQMSKKKRILDAADSKVYLPKMNPERSSLAFLTLPNGFSLPLPPLLILQSFPLLPLNLG